MQLMRTFWRGIALCSVAMPLYAQEAGTLLTEDFEGAIPDLHTYRATYAGDETVAHRSDVSLRVIPEGRGGAYFRLDGVVDRTSDCEFSAWVRAGSDGAAELYISASDGEKRFTLGSVAGGRADEWVKLTGTVRAEDWQDAKGDIMLAMVTTGESWFDDVSIARVDLPDPPIEVYPQVEALLREQADARAMTIRRGEPLGLDATNAAFAADLAVPEVSLPDTPAQTIPSDGLLTFALDVPEPMYVTGNVALKPDEDLRPGLRAYVLSDSTLVGAPMVAAEPWGAIPVREAVPNIEGTPPPEQVDLIEWLLPAGRHYVTVAGPHFRPAGEFIDLRLTPTARAVQAPSQTFALMADTHFSTGRSPWMNVIMYEPSSGALPDELEGLQNEGVDFVLIAGDMTNSGVRSDFEMLAEALREIGLPIFGCVGNHDAYHASSRPDMLELVPGLFPGGDLNYVLKRGGLRFVVLDASYWRTKDGQVTDQFDRDNWSGIGLAEGTLQWLRDTLAADTRTPTIVMWHYGFYDRSGPTSCGCDMRGSGCVNSDEVRAVLEETPNVIATLCGHSHWNQVNTVEQITHIQNPAFAEWPNAYRVFRVYEERIEWELRQVANRGLIREAFTPEKAQTWMISTGPGDLAGEIALSR